jgi:PAS domain S-box-containing protein
MNDTRPPGFVPLRRLVPDRHPPDLAPAAERVDIASLQPILPAMIDALSDAIVVIDRERQVVAANRRYVESFGEGRRRVTRASCGEALDCPERDGPGAHGTCPACRAFADRQVQRTIRTVMDPSGIQRRWEATFNPICDVSGEVSHVVEVWRDITDRSALEAQLSHSERLASVGMLAAGVGHEINNPLASVLAGVESLARLLRRAQMDAPSHEEALEVLSLLEREVTRCRETTDKLMIMAQPYSSAPGWVDVNQAARDTASLLGYQMRKQAVELVERLDPELPRIWARDSGVRGVCMNLLMNAVQAMPQGGRITIASSRQGANVQLRVEDTGPGIASQHLSRIWDPFFTTKPPGQGTGLGLFVTHGVVTRYGGTVRVENRSEGGARFVVELPIDGTEGQRR